MAGYNGNGVFTAAICENILAGLDRFTRQDNLPELRRSFLGYLDALRSPENTAGVEIIPVQDGTKRKTVRIAYMQRAVESEVTEAEETNCTPGRYPDFLEDEFEVDKIASTEFGLKQREATLICQGGTNDQLIQRFMFRAFDAMNRKINRRLITTQSTNFGYNYGNTPPSATAKSVNVLVGSTGAPLATGVQTLFQDYFEKNQYQGRPLIIGQGNIFKYMKTIGTGCCNEDGVDQGNFANNSGGLSMYLDTMIEGVLGSGHFAMLAPGMLQFVPYYRYVDYNEGEMGTAFHTTVVDPRTGMTYDMKIDVDGCQEQYYVRLSLNYGLWIQPNDVFHPEDPLYQTNGSLRYIAATT